MAVIVTVKLEPLKTYQVVPGTGVNLNWSGCTFMVYERVALLFVELSTTETVKV